MDDVKTKQNTKTPQSSLTGLTSFSFLQAVPSCSSSFIYSLRHSSMLIFHVFSTCMHVKPLSPYTTPHCPLPAFLPQWKLLRSVTKLGFDHRVRLACQIADAQRGNERWTLGLQNQLIPWLQKVITQNLSLCCRHDTNEQKQVRMRDPELVNCYHSLYSPYSPALL